MPDFTIFLWAVLGHWVTLMGGAIMLGVGLYERLRKHAPSQVWFGLMLAFVVWAMYGTWKDQLDETRRLGKKASELEQDRDALQRANANLRTQVDDRQRQINDLEIRAAEHSSRVQVPSDSRAVRKVITFEAHETQSGVNVHWYRVVVRTDRVLLAPTLTFTFDGPVESFWRGGFGTTAKQISPHVFEQTLDWTWGPNNPLAFEFEAKKPTKVKSVTYRE